MRHGFLLIDKPRGPTSHDIVAQVRRVLGEKSVGHLGTLDPLATGLLVLAVGKKALKVVELFSKLEKEYVAEMTCGAVSTTYDAEGVLEAQAPKAGWLPPIDASKIQTLITDHFVGKISQAPPAFSAIHIGGERAYQKAMRGETVEMKARETTIQECTVTEYSYPIVKLQVHCDSGTYIRSLAHDLGQTMRCGAYLSGLRRTRVGEWDVSNAELPDKVTWTDVLPLKDILKDFSGKEITKEEWQELQHGRPIDGAVPDDSAPFLAWFDGLPVAILEEDRRFDRKMKPRKVL